MSALRRTELLDSDAEEAFDRLTRLASHILRAPVALMSLVDADRQFFKSSVGLGEPWASRRETPLSHSFCQHAVVSGAPLIVEDARTHPLVHDNLAIPDLNVIAYAGVPLIDPQGHALGSLCVIDGQARQWTEAELGILKELAASVMTEIELRAATREAQQASAARDELFSMVTHDLKNPLSAIKGTAELLRRRVQRGELDTERLATGLDRIQTASNKMTAQLDELLDLAAIRSGQPLELSRRPVDLVALARQICDEQQHTTTIHEIRFETALHSLVAEYDATRIERVFSNLIANAIKYSPAGGPVTVALETGTDEAGTYALLRVRDNGIGIPAVDLPSVFEPFRR
ncbi:MAG TPA: GAF domain-containing sensor histidine kinase, partial [Roseiflexaceae bacterium]|nr:GAF domain-containing sensor histidine kinase [Roseiflexaceae bacterium]